jgi:hydroxyacylglutathione hydrolase
MTPEETRAATDEGAVVLDLRPPRPFAMGHVPGAINMQFNRADLADRVDLVLPKTQQLLIHAEPSPIATTAVRILSDAGFMTLGHLEGGLAAWRGAGFPVEELILLNVDDLRDNAADYRILDVRERFEYRHGHIPGAELLASGSAWQDAEHVPGDRPIAVICGDQTRSAAVASMLLRAGRDARLVMGGMVDWIERGYPVEQGSVPA